MVPLGAYDPSACFLDSTPLPANLLNDQYYIDNGSYAFISLSTYFFDPPNQSNSQSVYQYLISHNLGNTLIVSPGMTLSSAYTSNNPPSSNNSQSNHLPSSVNTAFTQLQTDTLSLVDLAWPFVVSIIVAFIVLKLFKKSAHAAS